MYIATIANKGLEDINREEIESLGAKFDKQYDFINIFKVKDLDSIVKIALKTQTSKRVLWVKFFSEPNIDSIIREANQIDYSEIINKKFAVRAHKYDIDIDIMDLYNRLGDVIRRKTNNKVDLTNPDVIFRGYILKDIAIFGYDLIGEQPLDKRYYRVYYHPAGLAPTIANSLIRLTKWNGQSLLDPLCGSGTIPIEAALYLREIPPLYRQYDKTFAYQLNPDIIDEIEQSIKWDRKAKILCFDKFVKHMRGAELNCIHARVKDIVKVSKINLEDVDFKLGEKAIDYIITNPPYGIKAADREESEKVHEYLFYQAEYILKDNGVLALLSPHKEWVLKYAEKYNFTLKHEREIYHNKLKVFFFQFLKG